MSIALVPLENAFIPDAINLVREEIRREQDHVPPLPLDHAAGPLADAVAHAVRNATGIAAIENSRLIGFMAFYGPIERFLGAANGAFSPIHAHAASGDDRMRLYERMFALIAARLVDQGMTSLAFAALAHDHDAANAFSLNGFGIRSADAIRDIRQPARAAAPEGYAFRELGPDDFARIHPLENGLIRHLRSSPTFLPVREMDEATFLRDRTRDTRFFVTTKGDDTVGYVKVTSTGENVLTTVPRMKSISGAYLLPEHRGTGLFSGLVAYTANALHRDGVELLGVDCETMNPTARRFWAKTFTTYTHSYVRRVDEDTQETETS